MANCTGRVRVQARATRAPTRFTTRSTTRSTNRRFGGVSERLVDRVVNLVGTQRVTRHSDAHPWSLLLRVEESDNNHNRPTALCSCTTECSYIQTPLSFLPAV